jgi:hypothetical protein
LRSPDDPRLTDIIGRGGSRLLSHSRGTMTIPATATRCTTSDAVIIFRRPGATGACIVIVAVTAPSAATAAFPC